jgi:hypothetical protein
MSNSDNELHPAMSDEEIEHNVKMGEALKELRKNPHFKTVIEEGYLEQKALAAVSLLAVPQMKDQGRRPDLMEDLIAISNLQYFFRQVEMMHIGATEPVLSDEEQAQLEDEV